MTTPAENAAAVTESVVENAVEAAGAAVAAAEARAEAAEEVAALVTEAAVRTELSDRIDDAEEGIEACQNRLASLETTLQGLQQSLTTLVTMEMLTAQLATLQPPPTTLPPSIPPPPETTETTSTPVNPSDESADGPQEPAPAKRKQFRLT